MTSTPPSAPSPPSLSSPVEAPKIYTPSSSTASSQAATKEEEQWHPILLSSQRTQIRKDMGGRSITICTKVFRDAEGMFWSKEPIGNDSSFTNVVNINLSSSCKEFWKTVEEEVPERKQRSKLGIPVSPIKLRRLVVSWKCSGLGYAFTDIKEKNCEMVLKLIAARGWVDMLEAYYEVLEWVSDGGSEEAATILWLGIERKWENS